MSSSCNALRLPCTVAVSIILDCFTCRWAIIFRTKGFWRLQLSIFFFTSRLLELYTVLYINPRSWELRTQKIKFHLVRTQSLNVLPLKPTEGPVYSQTCYVQCQGFLPCLFLHFRSIHLHFFETSPDIFLCLQWLTPVLVQVSSIKQVTLLDAGSRFECPRNINKLKKYDVGYDDL